jgi:coronin-1B/1C/6
LLFSAGHLDDPIVMVELDTSNGVMFPMYDPDANLVYLCGKVDLNSPFKFQQFL